MWRSLIRYLRFRRERAKGMRHYRRIERGYDAEIAAARAAKKKPAEIREIEERRHWELELTSDEIGWDTSQYLTARAFEYQVPIPQGDDDWRESSQLGLRFLSRHGAKKVKDDIRAEQRAIWEAWRSTLALVLSIVATIVGVLAYLKK